jgi:hypothetical protein
VSAIEQLDHAAHHAAQLDRLTFLIGDQAAVSGRH